jgi:hypothetical protein
MSRKQPDLCWERNAVEPSNRPSAVRNAVKLPLGPARILASTCSECILPSHQDTELGLNVRAKLSGSQQTYCKA